ncbi:nucleotidyl transferase AbiEii/AbiGii toxin family protein [Pseudorhodoplanes sp.]|uniref:nucleotidyl transferase AbiEii/AbiGii toxin family protein n=1 Tax=Pseudorhodoplanes sp. TaxID=1934341 RepID=UPI003D12E628
MSTAQTSHGYVKSSYSGGMGIGRINNPLETQDSVLLVASPEDLLATKLKAILDRAEAKDYSDIAALLASGVSLERSLSGFAQMYHRDPALPLRAMGFFQDGDLPSLPQRERDVLRNARDRVKAIPGLAITSGSLAG